MTTHVPRKAYSQQELAELYPHELELQLVQIVSLGYGARSQLGLAIYMALLGKEVIDFETVASSWFATI